ncbi:B-cell antigen receptor complex-associated protein beta chain [Hyperolius riggenbachi]|uniref:B-cell antigen receptor complex-associated protein beta chain n=1 Tax=Hyperolius riggenbachi TaxID=752182 RepID=UPI0035A2BF99
MTQRGNSMLHHREFQQEQQDELSSSSPCTKLTSGVLPCCMWGHIKMNTAEATVAVIFIAILILDQGDTAVGCDPHADCVEQPLRFIGVRKGRRILMECGCETMLDENTTLVWYHEKPDGKKEMIEQDTHISQTSNQLIIDKVQLKDRGTYSCEFIKNGVSKISCGTELMVLGKMDSAAAKSRSTMKDAIIMIQTILIVLFTTVPIMLFMEMKKKRSVKLEDHIYEGLDTCQTATYEDIQTVRVLATKLMEGEHPCVE